ncbi:MAG: 3-dehydroquinate synthase [Deltaproteobacteria bacterium]|nr:3-dehydroquinate synthase [Deltaproteobacteria bacterium]
MRILPVTLPHASYRLVLGADILDTELPALVRQTAEDLVLVVTNTTLEKLYPDRIKKALAGLPLRVETCVLPDGEAYKNMEHLQTVWDRLMGLSATRRTLVVAFGGGVVGDMAGFAAACFMRGVPLVQVPTTLLAMVDSSIGGKTGVNHPQGKNTIGAFKQPEGVVMDVTFLRTLPPRERKAGLMELVKHGLILDSDLLDFLAINRDRLEAPTEELHWPFWEEAVERSCRVKARVVEEDEKEQSIRALLNFGHSLGHLIETHTRYEAYLHGESVGTGMAFAAFLSWKWGMLDQPGFNRVLDLLMPLLTPVVLPPLDQEGFSQLLLHDKKSAKGGLTYVLLEKPGRAVLRKNTTPDEVWPVFLEFCHSFPGLCRLGE